MNKKHHWTNYLQKDDHVLTLAHIQLEYDSTEGGGSPVYHYCKSEYYLQQCETAKQIIKEQNIASFTNWLEGNDDNEDNPDMMIGYYDTLK